jgi:hypothetical protein
MHPRLLALLIILPVAGCSIGTTTGTVTLKMPISGGELVPVDFNRGSVVNSETDQIRIEKTLFSGGKDLKGSYIFGFYEKKGGIPRRVVVEDVSDDEPTLWVDDRNPVLKNGHWEYSCPPVEYAEKSLRWLREIDNSVRIYRFTIEQGDGPALVLYEPAVFPAPVKEFIKKQIDDAAAAAAKAAAAREAAQQADQGTMGAPFPAPNRQ